MVEKVFEKVCELVMDIKDKVEKIVDCGVNYFLNWIGLVMVKDI